MSGALRERASACSRARAVTDYRDVFLVRFDGFAGRFSVARTRRDDRSGSAPIFVSASGFSRLGLSDRPPYPSARDARLTIPPPFHPVRNSTAVKCSAAKPAFVEKVEKAGKAALSGLAASAILASVRPANNNDIWTRVRSRRLSLAPARGFPRTRALAFARAHLARARRSHPRAGPHPRPVARDAASLVRGDARVSANATSPGPGTAGTAAARR